MKSLEKAIDLVMAWPAKRRAQRDEVISHLEAIAKDCRAARDLWQEYFNNPGETGQRWALITWLGPDRVKQLHEINLNARAHLRELANTAGPEAGRFILFEDDIIEMAYRQLPDGQTGPDAAQNSIAVMKDRIGRMEEWIKRLRSTEPAAGKSGAKKAAKKPAKKSTPSTKPTKAKKPKPAPNKK